MTETIKELICICCPKGCHLRVDTANDYAVTGNACPNGAAYGKEELTHPTRIITSTVRITGGLYPRCPVKTAQAVPKEKMFSVMAALNTAALQAPAHTGPRYPARTRPHRAGGAGRRVRHRRGCCGNA